MQKKDWIRTLSALILSSGIAAFVYRFLPRELSTSTDIIGFPVFYNFNINRVFHQYYCFGLLLPLCWAVLMDVFKVAPWIAIPKVKVDEALNASVISSWFSASLVGLGLGLIVSVYQASFFWLGFFLYGGILGLVGIFAKRSWISRAFNCIGASCFPLVLAAGSSMIRVDEGVVNVSYSWFSFEFALLTTIGLMIATLAVLKRNARGIEGILDWEWKLILWVCVPILLFLGVAETPGPVRTDWYHYGESLASGRLLEKGLMPYRDLMFVHGLWMDPLRGIFGTKLFGDFRWAREAITTLVVHPLYQVFYYFLIGSALRWRRTPVLILGFLAPMAIPEVFYHPQFRFLFQPLALAAALYALRVRGAWWPGFLASSVATLQFVLVPESAFHLVGLAVVFGMLSWTDRKFQFREWLGLGAGVVLVLAVWALWLLRVNALDGYLHYLRTFTDGHRFGSGIPGNELKGIWHVLMFIVPGLCVWWFILSIYQCLRFRKSVSPEKALLWLLGFFGAFYYQKSLSRLDVTHLFQVYTVFIPFILIFLGLEWYERTHSFTSISSRPILQWLPLAICIVLAPLQLSATPNRLQKSIPVNAEFTRAKYSDLKPEEMTQLRNFKRFYDHYLESNDLVFDFTDQPDIHFFQLDRVPASSYFTPIMATHQSQQLRVISELERSQPKVVIYFSPFVPHNPMDDVPHFVRHYLISDYIHRHYKPFLNLNKHSILIRKDLNWDFPADGSISWEGEVKPVQRWAELPLPPCDFGQSLNFLKPYQEYAGLDRKAVELSVIEKGNAFEINLPRSLSESARLSLELSFSRESPGQIRFSLGPSVLRAEILSKTSKMQVPLGSCPYIHDFLGQRIEGERLGQLHILSWDLRHDP